MPVYATSMSYRGEDFEPVYNMLFTAEAGSATLYQLITKLYIKAEIKNRVDECVGLDANRNGLIKNIHVPYKELFELYFQLLNEIYEKKADEGIQDIYKELFKYLLVQLSALRKAINMSTVDNDIELIQILFESNESFEQIAGFDIANVEQVESVVRESGFRIPAFLSFLSGPSELKVSSIMKNLSALLDIKKVCDCITKNPTQQTPEIPQALIDLKTKASNLRGRYCQAVERISANIKKYNQRVNAYIVSTRPR